MNKIMVVIAAAFLLVPATHSLNTTTITFGPYTQNVSNDSITIVWETSMATSINSVKYWNGEERYTVYDNSTSTHHEIRISPPFSTGYYSVSSDDVSSNEYEFELASHCYETGEFRCVMYGDSRGHWDNWKHAKEVANAINKEKPDIVIHGRDMVGEGADIGQWNAWLSFMMPLMQNTTLFGVLGNHEKNGSRYYQIFSLPNNEMWYSFYYDPCQFIVLDNYAPWNKTSSQYRCLRRNLPLQLPSK